jgi:hypothetical protein
MAIASGTTHSLFIVRRSVMAPTDRFS